jgi:hypothetical protein
VGNVGRSLLVSRGVKNKQQRRDITENLAAR